MTREGQYTPTLAVVHKRSAFTPMRKRRKALPVRARPQEAPGNVGEKCASARRKPDESRHPVLRHQINFTLSHLPAAVMSFIHPFPRSYGNPPAWSSFLFYICLSLLLLRPSPSPDPSEPSPLTPSERYSHTPPASPASIPSFSHYHRVIILVGGEWETKKGEAPGVPSYS